MTAHRFSSVTAVWQKSCWWLHSVTADMETGKDYRSRNRHGLNYKVRTGACYLYDPPLQTGVGPTSLSIHHLIMVEITFRKVSILCRRMMLLAFFGDLLIYTHTHKTIQAFWERNHFFHWIIFLCNDTFVARALKIDFLRKKNFLNV